VGQAWGDGGKVEDEKRERSNAEKLKRGNAENGRILSEYAGGKYFAS
jgi:hypothetical protein